MGILARIAGAWRLALAVWRKSRRHRLGGEAARLAYFFFLSIFPFMMVLFALTGMLGGDAAFRQAMSILGAVAPPDAERILSRFVLQVTNQPRPDVLSLGLVLSLWTASNIFSALSEALDGVYEAQRRRTWWRRRLLSMVLVGMGAGLLAIGAVFLATAPRLLSGLPFAFQVLSWPLAFIFMTLLIALVLHFLPSRDQRQARRQVLAGALVGAGMWLLATQVFRAYVTNLRNYSATYGIVGTVIVLLLWLYLTAYTILLGGEVAAALERAPPKPRRAPRPRVRSQASSAR